MEEKVCDTTGRWTLDLPSQLACKYDKRLTYWFCYSLSRKKKKKERCTVINVDKTRLANLQIKRHTSICGHKDDWFLLSTADCFKKKDKNTFSKLTPATKRQSFLFPSIFKFLLIAAKKKLALPYGIHFLFC